MRSTTFIFFITALVTLAVFHILSLAFFLYWTYLWLDIPMHLLGGITVSLGFLTFFVRYARVAVAHGLPVVLGVTLLVGGAWELFEWSTGVISTEVSPIPDTLMDLAMDFVGGSIGYFLARKSQVIDTM